MKGRQLKLADVNLRMLGFEGSGPSYCVSPLAVMMRDGVESRGFVPLMFVEVTSCSCKSLLSTALLTAELSTDSVQTFALALFTLG